MKTSLQGRLFIIAHEGIVTSRYLDSVGVWTIGVGITKAANAGIDPEHFHEELLPAKAIGLFERVLERYETDVRKAIKVPLEQHQFDALVSFHYNTGGIFRATATRLINAGDMVGGAKALMNWCKPIELKKRREAEVMLFRAGIYGDLTTIVYPATKTGKVRWSAGKKYHPKYLVGGRVIDTVTKAAKPSVSNDPPEPQAPAEEPTSVSLEQFEAEQALDDTPNRVIEDALRERGSRTIQHADKVRSGSFWQKAWSALSTGALAPVFIFLEGVPAWAKALVVIAVIGIIVVALLAERQSFSAREINAARVDDAKTGRNLSRLDFLVAAVRGR